MSMWNPWRGCKRCSDGCLHCYIHKGDAKRGIDTSEIVKTKDFYKPIERLKNGNYKMKSGMVYLCFSTDFLIEEADEWRKACWSMIRERADCTFLFLTKRIERLKDCLPEDWGDGYDNVVIGCTVENQKNADRKLSVFQALPIKHKCCLNKSRSNNTLTISSLWWSAENPMRKPGPLITPGHLTSGRSACARMFRLSSGNAERISSKTGKPISCRPRTYAARQKRAASISRQPAEPGSMHAVLPAGTARSRFQMA